MCLQAHRCFSQAEVSARFGASQEATLRLYTPEDMFCNLVESFGLNPEAFPTLLYPMKNLPVPLPCDLIHSRLILVNWSIFLLESLK